MDNGEYEVITQTRIVDRYAAVRNAEVIKVFVLIGSGICMSLRVTNKMDIYRLLHYQPHIPCKTTGNGKLCFLGR